MGDCRIVGRRRGRIVVIAALAAIGVVLALASPAAIAKPTQAGKGAAGPNTDPVRSWSLSDVNQGDGEVVRRSDFQQGGTLHKSIVVGSAAFDLQRPSPYDKLPTEGRSRACSRVPTVLGPPFWPRHRH